MASSSTSKFEKRFASPNISRSNALSRNSLYAPIQDINKQAPSTPTSSFVDKKLREKTLYSFLETVSSDYHSPTSILGIHYDGRSNHGSRKINYFNMEQSLAQRALTLIGGGIGTALASSTSSDGSTSTSGGGKRKRKQEKNTVHRIHGSLSKKKRKKHNLRRLESLNTEEETNENVTIDEIKTTKTNEIVNHKASTIAPKTQVENSSPYTTSQIYKCLNEMWKRYIRTLLGEYTPSSSEKVDNNSVIQNQISIASFMSSAEYVGALAQIKDCKEHSSYVGRSGIIVDVTANTWKVAAVPKGLAVINMFGGKGRGYLDRNDNSRDISSVKKNEKRQIRNNEWKVITIPKRKTALKVYLPSNNDDSLEGQVEHSIILSGES